jgi:hypothetical protein
LCATPKSFDLFWRAWLADSTHLAAMAIDRPDLRPSPAAPAPAPPPRPDLAAFAQHVRRVRALVDTLRIQTAPNGPHHSNSKGLEPTENAESHPAPIADPVTQSEWYAALTLKLLPQLGDAPYLVVAVVGGTNIGKSAVFNHLAGENVAASNARASHTKHPTCLIPAGFDATRLAGIFPGFSIHPWQGASESAGESAEDQLFWKASPRLPVNLLLLDTPDIDSDAKVNWRRADAIRHSADLLVAVLTMQKYNDAAVKQFFREAAREDKVVLVVFNLLEFPYDEEFWPHWLATFCEATGVDPELVFLAPRDRAATEELRLPFMLRQGSLPTLDHAEGAVVAAGATADAGSADALRRAICERHFDAIKLRTVRGAVARLTHPLDGCPAWIDQLVATSERYAEAARQLAADSLLRDDHWPLPPGGELVTGVRTWWAAHRQGLTRTLHTLYGRLGDTLLVPVRWTRDQLTGPPPKPWDDYRRREWGHVVDAVERVLAQLTRLSQLGNEILRPRLERLLGGAARERLLESLRTDQSAVDYAAIVETVVAGRMTQWQSEQANLFGYLKLLDQGAAVARPVISVGLFFVGAGPVGGAVTGAVPDLLAQSLLVHVTSETLATAGTVVAGEAGVAAGTTRLQQVAVWLTQLHAGFVAQRTKWLAEHLHRELLAGLLDDLQSHGPKSLTADVAELRALLGKLKSAVAIREKPITPANSLQTDSVPAAGNHSAGNPAAQSP